MSKKKEDQSSTASSAERSPQEVYDEHNHQSAQEADVKLQCQCDTCKAHRKTSHGSN